MLRPRLLGALIASAIAASAAHASTDLIAIGSLTQPADLSSLTGPLENGAPGDVLGGIGSALAWSGGNTFLLLPDRGPNAIAWAGGVGFDNTTSFITRFHTVTLELTATPSGGLPFTLTPTLTGTTLLYSPTALNYGGVTPSVNGAGKFYFSGRSDNFGAGDSLNDANGRFDPEGLRVSNDGQFVYASDEYGPYVYKFDRATGARLHTYVLPGYFAISNLSSLGATEISGNTTGRVANKGMEGLAITPDGSLLVGFEQSPLIQDGGDGGRANRLVTIDVATGTTHEYIYDNFLADTSKTYNSSEILALNNHEFLVLERDGKGKGDGSNAVVKRIYKVDLTGATDVAALNGGAGTSGEANLLPFAVSKQLFLDLKVALGAHGIGAADVPAKLEGMAFGEDVVIGGTTYHTLYVANDNDFIPGTAGPNNVYVFTFTDADLGGSVFENQHIGELAWTDLGSGLPGVAGVPALAGTGTLAPGSAGSLSLTSANPSAVAVLFVSLTSTPAPFKGGTLVAVPLGTTVALTTDASGEIALPFTWPTGLASATALYVQFAIQDAAAVKGVALSNALKGLTP